MDKEAEEMGIPYRPEDLVNNALLTITARLATAVGAPVAVGLCLWGANSLYNIQLTIRDIAGSLNAAQHQMAATDRRLDTLEGRFNAYVMEESRQRRVGP